MFALPLLVLSLATASPPSGAAAPNANERDKPLSAEQEERLMERLLPKVRDLARSEFQREIDNAVQEATSDPAVAQAFKDECSKRRGPVGFGIGAILVPLIIAIVKVWVERLMLLLFLAVLWKVVVGNWPWVAAYFACMAVFCFIGGWMGGRIGRALR